MKKAVIVIKCCEFEIAHGFGTNVCIMEFAIGREREMAHQRSDSSWYAAILSTAVLFAMCMSRWMLGRGVWSTSPIVHV